MKIYHSIFLSILKFFLALFCHCSIYLLLYLFFLPSFCLPCILKKKFFFIWHIFLWLAIFYLFYFLSIYHTLFTSIGFLLSINFIPFPHFKFSFSFLSLLFFLNFYLFLFVFPLFFSFSPSITLFFSIASLAFFHICQSLGCSHVNTYHNKCN